MQIKRAERIAAVIHEKVGNMLIRGLKDPELSLITITKVRVTDDVSHAKIYYSVYGDEKRKLQAAQALERAKGFIRTEISHELKVRTVPTLAFCYDDSVEYADHIERLLKQIQNESH
ncbi:MAG: 30S ribosome-binding factor RbfA [Calditrichaeota bacterium]|nr:MAG: 30S ribosome-binding factor RbfA [Calditrichota bacterium]